MKGGSCGMMAPISAKRMQERRALQWLQEKSSIRDGTTMPIR
jgi:hypothetical protein